jgi:hypothetical protein
MVNYLKSCILLTNQKTASFSHRLESLATGVKVIK